MGWRGKGLGGRPAILLLTLLRLSGVGVVGTRGFWRRQEVTLARKFYQQLHYTLYTAKPCLASVFASEYSPPVGCGPRARNLRRG